MDSPATGKPEESLNVEGQDWDDLLGTGSILKRIIKQGDPGDPDIESPREYCAIIDIETRCNGVIVQSESHNNFFLNCDADLFCGPHIVIPLMNLNEEAEYIFDPKFGFSGSNEPTSDSKLYCKITLKFRVPKDELIPCLNSLEKYKMVQKKKDRGKFWVDRGNYANAISVYKSLIELCDDETTDVD